MSNKNKKAKTKSILKLKIDLKYNISKNFTNRLGSSLTIAQIEIIKTEPLKTAAEIKRVHLTQLNGIRGQRI